MPTPLAMVLQVGDTSSPTDFVDLMDQTNCVVMAFDEGTISEPEGPSPEDSSYAWNGRRTLKLGLYVIDTAGQSYSTAEQTIRKIEQKLVQARRALGAGGQWLGAPVTLRCVLPAGSLSVYFDVVGGSLTQRWVEKGANPVISCDLVLSCLPYARGDVVTLGPLNVAIGNLVCTFTSAIPGDRSALCTLRIADLSSPGNTNRIRVGRRSLIGMAGPDFRGLIQGTSQSPGANVADAGSLNGFFSRITGNANWQTICAPGTPELAETWESGTFANWTTHTTGGAGSLSEIIAGAKLTGSFGYHAKAGTAGGFGEAIRTLTRASTATHLTCWLNVRNSLTTGSGTYMQIQNSSGSGGIAALAYNGGFQLQVRNLNGTTTNTALSPTISAATWTKVRLVYDTFSNNGQPVASCYLSTDGRAWTLAAQYQDATAGTLKNLDQGVLVCFNASGAILPEAWYDNVELGDYSVLYPQVHGQFDVWARARTTASALSTPTNQAYTITYGVGSVQVGGYQIVITSLDGSGNETAGSTPLGVTMAATGEIILGWQVNGTASNHRVYVFDALTGFGRWSWVATGSASGSYTLSSAIPLANSGAPPNTTSAALAPAYLRGAAAISSIFGTPNYVIGDPAQFQIGNGNWETVYLGTFDLPPAPRSEQNIPGNALPDLPWTLLIQGLLGGTGSSTIDVDSIYLLPHDEPQMTATFFGLTNTSNVDWELDTRRDGRTSGVLREIGSLNPVGQVRIDGRLSLGRGVNYLQFIVEQANGVSAPANLSWTVNIDYRPRYAHLSNVVGGI